MINYLLRYKHIIGICILHFLYLRTDFSGLKWSRRIDVKLLNSMYIKMVHGSKNATHLNLNLMIVEVNLNVN